MNPKSTRLQGATGLLLVAIALTIAMAGPVLRSSDSRLFGHEIVGRHQDPFVVIDQFEDPRAPGLYTQPATDYLGAAIAAIVGDGVSAYNAVVLLSFPLAALFAYLLAFQLTESRPASWLAGLFYAFAPFHVAQSAYHPHGAQIQWLPGYLLALWLCVGGVGLSRLTFLAVSLCLVVLSNFYYGLMAAVLTPFALVGFWAVQTRLPNTPPRGLTRTVLALAVLAAAGLGYVACFAPKVLSGREQLAFPRGDLQLYGAKWSSYLTPPVDHPLLGIWVDSLWESRGPGDILEQQITIGFGLALLSGLAVAGYLRGTHSRLFAAAPALVLIAAAAFVVSLAPGSSSGAPSLLRPSSIFYEFLPMFRAYARFGIVVFLAAAILGSAGAVWLLTTRSRSLQVLACALLLVAVVELVPFPPFRWRDVLPTSAHRLLSDSDQPVRLLDCVAPSNLAELPAFQRFSHRVSTLTPHADCGDPDFPTRLAHEGYTHFLVRRPSPLAEWLVRRPAPEGAKPLGHFGDALLFELEPSTDRPYLEFGRGFHWREYLEHGTYRWMGSSGSLWVANPTAEPLSLRIELQLHAFPHPRVLVVAVDGAAVTELEIGTEVESYELPSLALAPGKHSVTLTPRSAAVTADSVLHNGDAREMTVSLWGWRVSQAG